MSELLEDGTDIGHSVVIALTTWQQNSPVGLIEEHPTPSGGRCTGGIMFDLPGVADAFPGRALWDLVSVDPLTVHPSLLCRICGHHGWIRAGVWVPC